MKLINQSKNIEIVSELSKATTFGQRLVGLLGKKDMSLDEGLLIAPCKIVHTFLMDFPLDLIFLDSSNSVVKLVTSLQPNRVSPLVLSAAKVIELRSRSGLEEWIDEGDELVILD